VRLRRGRSQAGIPFADLPALAPAIRRTAILRYGLGAALVVLLFVLFLMARSRDVRTEAFFAPDRSGVVVADFSASVSPLTYRRMGRALRRIVAANEPVGMIVFSDAAYELVPPGTPGVELAPLLRYFEPIPGTVRSQFEAQFPANPWRGGTFQAGTRISEGLRVAYDILRRDGVGEATVLLLSDLEAPDSDHVRIAEGVTTLQNHGYEIRIVPLFAQPQNRAFFEKLVGKDAFVAETSLVRPIEGDELGLGGSMPWLYLGLGALVVLLLAANERWCGRLSVPWRVGG
jgi:hypothetical protein